MKYCPNRACRHARRFGSPAEFAERATTCNDCGMDLVLRDELATEATASRVKAFHARARAEQEAAAEGSSAVDPIATARIDLTTGIVLLALGAALIIVPMFMTDSQGNTRIFIAIGPMAYGMMRLERGLSARRPEKT